MYMKRRRLTGVAEAIRLIAQRSGLGWEASPKRRSGLKEIFSSFILFEIVLSGLFYSVLGAMSLVTALSI